MQTWLKMDLSADYILHPNNNYFRDLTLLLRKLWMMWHLDSSVFYYYVVSRRTILATKVTQYMASFFPHLSYNVLCIQLCTPTFASRHKLGDEYNKNYKKWWTVPAYTQFLYCLVSYVKMGLRPNLSYYQILRTQ